MYTNLAIFVLIVSILVFCAGILTITFNLNFKWSIIGGVLSLVSLMYFILFYSSCDFHINLIERDIANVKNEIEQNKTNCIEQALDDETLRICKLIETDLKWDLKSYEMSRDSYLVKKFKK